MSALPPSATEMRTSIGVRLVPIMDMRRTRICTGTDKDIPVGSEELTDAGLFVIEIRCSSNTPTVPATPLLQP